jgi:hypothetical protein
MQKISIAIVLALTLSCVVAADYSIITAGWVKAPVSICNDTEYTCSNLTTIELVGLTSSDVNLASYNAPTVDKNTSAASWSVFTKTIVSKDLSSTVNATNTYKGDESSSISFGYAIAFVSALDSNNITQAYLYQSKIVTGSAELPRVQLTNNTNINFTAVGVVGYSVSSKTIFVFYTVADKKVNATSLDIGTSKFGKEFTLTSAFTGLMVSVATGEAISANQVYATWYEGDTTYKVSIVDFSAASLINTATLGKWDKTYRCEPYSTDKKYYGVVCSVTVNTTTTVYVSANSTDLLQIFTTNASTRAYGGTVAYGPYLAFFYRNPTAQNATVVSYDIWNVETFAAFKNGTDFITLDMTGGSGFAQYRIPQGGLYVVAYNARVNATQPNTKIVVGLLLGSSYLTSVFGFLLTIIAGLFLF